MKSILATTAALAALSMMPSAPRVEDFDWDAEQPAKATKKNAGDHPAIAAAAAKRARKAAKLREQAEKGVIGVLTTQVPEQIEAAAEPVKKPRKRAPAKKKTTE